MSETVDLIKERLSILDVVSPYVKLTRAGRYWKGLSPFTKEKTPSFFVSPDRGLYHCFSTGKGGDMFTFIEEMEGVDFRGALKLLADKAGVALIEERPEARDEKEKVFAALDAAKIFFEDILKTRPEVLEYLEKRGLKKEMVESWGIGYAPNEWQSLHPRLIQKGFSEKVLETAGLVKKADESSEFKVQSSDKTQNSELKTQNSRASRVYDRFRGRIMFPIYDISGRVIAFSGRIFEDDINHPQAKYLNSPETIVFDKSRALYGLHVAKEAIRSLGAVILVEGQLDLLMAHQAGYKNTVATSGTAFTEKHAELLKRYTPNILISYDGDRAGISAAGRAAALSLQAGMNVKIAKLPPGEDPADVIKGNVQVYKDAIKQALHVVDFYLAHIAEAKYDARTFRLEVSRTVLPYIGMIPNKIDQAHFISKVAAAIQVPEEAVLSEVKKVQSSESRVQSPNSELETQNSRLPREPFLSRMDALVRLVYGLMKLFEEAGRTEEANDAKAALQEVREEDMTRLQSADERAGLFEADFFLERYLEEESRKQVLKELYTELEKELKHEKYRETLQALKVAELAHDQASIDLLMKELTTLANTLGER